VLFMGTVCGIICPRTAAVSCTALRDPQNPFYYFLRTTTRAGKDVGAILLL
jgi:hypothetical protein